jgi:hypothetical protein
MRKLKKASEKSGRYSLQTCVGVAILCSTSFLVGLNVNFMQSINLSSTGPGGKSNIPSTFFSSSSSSSSITSHDDNKLAHDQSFGFFNDIPSIQWKRHQHIISQYEKHFNPNDPLEFVPGHSKRKMKYFNSPQAFYQTNYEPNFSCRFERRIGGNGNGDGPKWVCDPHNLVRLSKERKRAHKRERKHHKQSHEVQDEAGCLVYSIGSNGDFQFETGLQNLLGSTDICEIHIFDMGDYEDKMPKGLNIHYHRWGLIKDDESNAKEDSSGNDNDNEKDEGAKSKEKFYSLAEIVKRLGHENRPSIDIFKIDCDKCEWRTFKDWFSPSQESASKTRIPMLQQILVETHMSPKDFVLPFFNGIMDNGYVMFHKEPNIQFGGGEAIEFGFLKLDDTFFEFDNLKGESLQHSKE